MVAEGGSTWVSLPVATLRSQRLFSPLSSITVSTYFPSGDMAVTVARLELVTCVMAKFWNGVGAARRSSKYKPTPAATRMMSAAVAAVPYHHGRCGVFATAVALPLSDLDWTIVCAADVPSALTAGMWRLESVSR